jgi:pilus assembly protein CpaB
VKRRLLGIVGAIVLALAGTVMLINYVNGAEDRALAGQKVVEVLVAAEPIAAGTPASELDGKLEFEKIPAKVRAEGAVTSIDALGDRVSEGDLARGEQIVKSKFVESGGGAPTAEANLLQTTIALDPERALGGLVKPGDTVGVVVSFDDPQLSGIALHGVKITNVQLEQTPGTDLSEGGQAEGDEAATAPTGRFLVTVAVDAPSLEKVVFAAEHGKMWLAAEPSGADLGATQLITIDNIYA